MSCAQIATDVAGRAQARRLTDDRVVSKVVLFGGLTVIARLNSEFLPPDFDSDTVETEMHTRIGASCVRQSACENFSLVFIGAHWCNVEIDLRHYREESCVCLMTVFWLCMKGELI